MAVKRMSRRASGPQLMYLILTLFHQLLAPGDLLPELTKKIKWLMHRRCAMMTGCGIRQAGSVFHFFAMASIW